MTAAVFGLATAADIPAIMAIERTLGYEGCVGRWSETEHRQELDRQGSRYLVMRLEHRVSGFAILQHLDDPNLCADLRRVAVAEAGRGVGGPLVAYVVDHVFGSTPTHRLQLRVFVDNERARRAYVAVGFIEEGIIRDGSRTPDGSFRSMRLMSILRPAWDARKDRESVVQPKRSAR